MTKCEKCKKEEGTECVYYTLNHEGYLCKSCYKLWCKIAKTVKKDKFFSECSALELRYLKWLEEK
jgi:hypothetical protein